MATCCRCCSDRSNFGESLDCELVGPAGAPADGGFPCGVRLRGNLVRVVVQTGGVVRQHQVEVGDVEVRLVPVDQRDPIRRVTAPEVSKRPGDVPDDGLLAGDGKVDRATLSFTVRVTKSPLGPYKPR
jgi:hypothetical protein